MTRLKSAALVNVVSLLFFVFLKAISFLLPKRPTKISFLAHKRLIELGKKSAISQKNKDIKTSHYLKKVGRRT